MIEAHAKHAVAVAFACLAWAPAAHAHAMLEAAMPRVGSTVPNAPNAVVLTYSQAVEPAFSKVEVTDEAGTHEETGAPHTDGGDPRKLAVGLGVLTAGTYKVSWHVTSVDTHKTQGNFSFTVAP